VRPCAQFNLRAHFLDLRSQGFNLLLLSRGRPFFFYIAQAVLSPRTRANGYMIGAAGTGLRLKCEGIF
jgi:hypothetical protein